MTRRLEAMGQADYAGLTTPKHFNGVVRCLEHKLAIPLRWKKPRMVFVNSMSDLFHKDVPFEFIDKVFAVMAACQHHTFQVLTKRPERAYEYTTRLLPEHFRRNMEHWVSMRTGGERGCDSWPLPNVWLGTSVENQACADERREHLKACSAAVKFVSYEPALGPVDWTGWEFVHQIISGGESGPKARPHHPGWHRNTRDFCQANGIAYFFKQWGYWAPCDDHPLKRLGDKQSVCVVRPDGSDRVFRGDGRFTGEAPQGDDEWMARVGKKAAGRLLDGREWNEFPSTLTGATR